MYRLSNKVIRKLETDQQLRLMVAMRMGIGEAGVKASVKRNNGVSIATHYDAVNQIHDSTGILIQEIRQPVTKKQTAWA